ncbi:type IV pilus secretin PilQ [Suttonella sp. R2A3]|uniref:type IV pilus secretin PilQ n=1 Tax=Suttonella sp. R2A3 TaxID=2908648 RepID=UPI001F1E8235|nr:type IV pilus secretin PilQ [Suttonella sp. R2A3]UJF25105.1 type IV pilus secretin PilQ [Suttonella sp. R2A3]
MKHIALVLAISVATAAQAATLSDLSYGPTNGRYQLIFENAGVKPNVFTTAEPATIVLDFAGVNSGLSAREIAISQAGIYDVDVVEAAGTTRAVVNLAAPQSYEVVQQGKDIILLFTNPPKHMPAKAAPVATATASGGLFNSVISPTGSAGEVTISRQPTSVTPMPKPVVREPQPPTQTKQFEAPAQALLSPQFRKKDGNTAVISFVLPAQHRVVNTRKQAGEIMVTLDGHQLAKSEQKRMEFADFGTAVNYIDLARTTTGTNMVIATQKNTPYEYTTYQNGDIYTIELTIPKPDTSFMEQVDEVQGFSATKRYRGEPLSLNFQDIEVRAVLQIIAEFTGNNVVVSDAVSGNITLRLDNVPWDQALDIILKTKGLGMRENNSVIYIAPAAELDQRELDALRVVQERNELVPSRTELIQVQYARAADLVGIIEKSREGSGGEGRGAFFRDAILSSKGTVSVDERTNTLLVSDIPSKIQAVRELVAKLDEPVRQVLVDARLVITNDDFSRDLGAKFNTRFTSRIANENDQRGRDLRNQTLTGRLGVDLPKPATYGLAILGSDFLVDLELSALQTEGRGEIISSPRVVTQDGQKATIASGQEIPYQTVSRDGVPSVEFKEAELSLEVTPRIAPDNRVDMELNITKDSPNFANQLGNNVPINTNQLETNVLVDNGETIVLGGIYEQAQSISTNKVPLLGDLPLIGNVFKKTNNQFKKNELLIFVTPRIIDHRLSQSDKFSNLRD